MARWNQFTICWPETVGDSDRKLNISQTKWFNRTHSQLACTKIRVNKAHNAHVLHSRVMGRTLLPLQIQLLPHLTLLSTLIRIRSRLILRIAPLGHRTCTCDPPQLVSNPLHTMQNNDQQLADNENQSEQLHQKEQMLLQLKSNINTEFDGPGSYIGTRVQTNSEEDSHAPALASMTQALARTELGVIYILPLIRTCSFQLNFFFTYQRTGKPLANFSKMAGT